MWVLGFNEALERLAKEPKKNDSSLGAFEKIRREQPRGYCSTQFRHNSHGGVYTFIGSGMLLTSTPLNSYAEVVLYQGQDRRCWTRSGDEFDTRFTRIE
jgi:hypothetical protein